ncbi:MAG: hypothetical protein ACRCV3_02865 [Desulfovibrionaceae bacterium]
MRKYICAVVALCCSVMLAGCSLLKLELKSDAIPLSPEEQNLRLLAREYGEIFFAGIEESANIIVNKSQNVIYKENAILWKIYANSVAIDAIYKNQPTIAFMDIWAFVAQMQVYFTKSSSTLFGKEGIYALETVNRLYNQIDTIAKQQFSKANYEKAKEFLVSYVEQYPIESIQFVRQPIYTMWLESVKKSQDEGEEVALKTVGTLPEVLTDTSDKMSVLTRQMEKTLLWRTEIMMLHGEIDPTLFGKTLDNVYVASKNIEVILRDRDALMESISKSLTQRMHVLLQEVDSVAGKYGDLISQERVLIAEEITLQRVALAEMIEQERSQILLQVEAMRKSTVEEVFAQVQSLFSNILWLLIVLFSVVLFIPFGVGVFFGRVLSRKKK